MIFSKQLMFSNNQDVSQAVGTYVSTNVIDTGAPGTVYGAAAPLKRNVGPGTPVPVLVQLTEKVASAGAATMQFLIETADEEAFTVTSAVVAQSRVYPLADLVAGMQWGVGVLPNDMKRFIRVKYVIGGATTTTGTVTAGIVHGIQTA